MGVGNRMTIELECPFCKKGKIATFFVDSYIASKTSRISAGAKTTSYSVPAEYKIMGDCPECGKSRKDIQAKYDGTYREPRTKEQQLEEWKKRGLPLVLESKNKEWLFQQEYFFQ